MSARRPAPRCPRCDSVNVARIVYGYPGPEMAEKAGRGEIVLGGCCVTDADDNRACKDCGATWRTARKPNLRWS